MKSITVKEVISSFLATNRAKSADIVSVIKSHNPDKELKALLDSYQRLSRASLFSLVSSRKRAQMFSQHSWTMENVKLKYIGTWPGTGDLPIEWCQLSVLDAAFMIRKNSSKSKNLKSVKRIHSIQENIDTILKYFPPILIPGGSIRKIENFLFLPFDADDGSHRLIAAALSNKKSIRAYVGTTIANPS